MRKRKIKKYGNTWVVKLDTVDVKDFGFVEGDEVDIDDLNLLRQTPEEEDKEVKEDEQESR